MASHDTTHSSPSTYDIRALHPLVPAFSNEDNSANSSVTSSSPSSPPLSSADDVTTIFVVGFPDDMQEREFQNMFIFSKGFEATSLKWHFKEQNEDQDMFGTMLNGKRQMIGFARFRTRQEASEAVVAMNGKKVDMEKGSTLKAEMAKKNLHIKRSSIAPSVITSITSTLPSAAFLSEPLGSPMTILSRRLSQVQVQQPEEVMPDPFAAYESFSPLPSDLLSPSDHKNYPFLNEPLLTTPNTPSFSHSLFGIRSQSIDACSNANITINNYSNGDIVHPFQLFSKSFNASELDADPFNCLSKSTPASYHELFHSVLFSNNGDDLMSLGRKNSLQPPSNTERSSSISSNYFRLTNNPADQNPPCNTLYVGNLPPATSEDELRSLFANCQGYKRMCFRNKPQGPMCFVEFDDVVYATQVMSARQGHVLSNSIKGGIRLSFSKNPLFINPNKEAGLVFSFKQMGTALLADL